MRERTLHLLHVDDDENDRFFVVRAARGAGVPINVQNAPSGHDALAMLRSGAARADMLLLDIKMPGMSGFEFIEALQREEMATLPIVVYSTSEQESDIQRARKMGVHAYCVKPAGLGELVEFMKHLYEAWVRSEVPCEWPGTGRTALAT
jgi:CheY-like chemotaxis protein